MNPRASRTPLLLILSLSTALAASSLRAQDFAFHEVGARAATLGGSFTARADDATAIYYNPAGLAFLGGVQIKVDLTFSDRHIRASWPETGQTFVTAPHEFLGSLFLGWRPARGVSLGAGYYSPANFRSLWPRLWRGEEACISSKLNSRIVRFVLAAEPVKGLALGAALDLATLSAGWNHILLFEPANITFPEQVTVNSLHALTGHGTGFAAGVLWKIFPWLQAGARYQKGVAIGLTGENRFVSQTPYLTAPLVDPDGGRIQLEDLINTFYARQVVTGELTLPQEIAAGIVLRPFARISLSLDVQWNRWSELGRWEFKSVNADEDLSPAFTSAWQELYGIVPNYGIQGADLALGDTKAFKAGVEYRLGRWIGVRAGFTRLEGSVAEAGRTPIYPDPSLSVYSFGAGYEGPVYSIWDEETVLCNLVVDVFIRYGSSNGSASTLPGLELTYGARRLVAGVGVGFIF